MDLRIFTEPQFGATYGDQLAVAQAAEAGGFDAFFRSDHWQTFGGDGLPGPTDSWVTLGAIARETERIRLGTLVTSATFRYPGPLAVAVAQVDEMSGGRVELGIGAGWFDGEHDTHGIPFPATGERFDRLEEQLAVITGLWETPVGETFSFDGQHYPVDIGHVVEHLQRTPPPCPSPCSRRGRRSSSAATVRSGHRGWPPPMPTSSTSASPRSPTSPPRWSG